MILFSWAEKYNFSLQLCCDTTEDWFNCYGSVSPTFPAASKCAKYITHCAMCFLKCTILVSTCSAWCLYYGFTKVWIFPEHLVSQWQLCINGLWITFNGIIQHRIFVSTWLCTSPAIQNHNIPPNNAWNALYSLDTEKCICCGNIAERVWHCHRSKKRKSS